MAKSKKPSYVKRGKSLYVLEDRGTRVIIRKTKKRLWDCTIKMMSGCCWHTEFTFKGEKTMTAAKAKVTKEFHWL